MTIGQRIRFFRSLRGLTRRSLGIRVGLPGESADMRIAQYESGSVTPEPDMLKALADALEVSPLALTVPDIDSCLGVMQTFFALEDRYGLVVENRGGTVLLRVDSEAGEEANCLSEMLHAWASISDKYQGEMISKTDYDKWRYNYPKYEEEQFCPQPPLHLMTHATAKPFRGNLRDSEPSPIPAHPPTADE